MEITDNTRSTITQSLIKMKMTQTVLAKKMKTSKSWVSKLLNGTLKRLSDDQVDLLEEILETSLLEVLEVNPTPEMAKVLGERMKNSEELTDLVTSLLRLYDNKSRAYKTIPYLSTKDLVDFGKEIVRASHENPDKCGKVGKIAIEWLAWFQATQGIKGKHTPTQT